MDEDEVYITPSKLKNGTQAAQISARMVMTKWVLKSSLGPDHNVIYVIL